MKLSSLFGLLILFFASEAQAQKFNHQVICFHGPVLMVDYLQTNWKRLKNIETIFLFESSSQAVTDAQRDFAFTKVSQIWDAIEECSPAVKNKKQDADVFQQMGKAIAEATGNSNCQKQPWQNPAYIDALVALFPANIWSQIASRYATPVKATKPNRFSDSKTMAFAENETSSDVKVLPKVKDDFGRYTEAYKSALIDFEASVGMLSTINTAELPSYKKFMSFGSTGYSLHCEMFSTSKK